MYCFVIAREFSLVWSLACFDKFVCGCRDIPGTYHEEGGIDIALPRKEELHDTIRLKVNTGRGCCWYNVSICGVCTVTAVSCSSMYAPGTLRVSLLIFGILFSRFVVFQGCPDLTVTSTDVENVILTVGEVQQYTMHLVSD